tara:strand:- start:14951 stop:15556 length:606 start_codon:yes stop_codon:yes gene_type:complete
MENKGSGLNGKYKSLPKEYRAKLSAPLPKQAIKQHPTKTYLSTIKAIYITERLNDVFGIMGWDIDSEIIDTSNDYVVMKGRIYIREFDLYTPYQFGGHNLTGKGTEPADGYKSAVTDLTGKCASLIEIGIQVFKGMPESQEPNESKKDKPTPKKLPALNPKHESWSKAKEAIEKGTYSLDDIKKKYSLTPVNEKMLCNHLK